MQHRILVTYETCRIFEYRLDHFTAREIIAKPGQFEKRTRKHRGEAFFHEGLFELFKHMLLDRQGARIVGAENIERRHAVDMAFLALAPLDEMQIGREEIAL